MTIRLIPISLYEGGEGEYMLHIHENTVRQRSDQGIKKPCKIKVWGERQLQKVEVAALLSMLKEDNYYKRILV